MTSRPRPRSKATKEGHDAREVENGQRLLEKLPPEVLEKILDELDENDLFPLALSCRYFRQKQKELVARARQSGRESGDSRLTLKTSLPFNPAEGKPVSADYLRFCREEEVSGYAKRRIMCLAAFHGHLPLLQELLKPLKRSDPSGINQAFLDITRSAGESSSSQSPLLCSGF